MGFGYPLIIYYTLNVIFPVPGKYVTFEVVDVSEFDKSRDSMADDEGDAGSRHGTVVTCISNTCAYLRINAIP